MAQLLQQSLVHEEKSEIKITTTKAKARTSA